MEFYRAYKYKNESFVDFLLNKYGSFEDKLFDMMTYLDIFEMNAFWPQTGYLFVNKEPISPENGDIQTLTYNKLGIYPGAFNASFNLSFDAT